MISFIQWSFWQSSPIYVSSSWASLPRQLRILKSLFSSSSAILNPVHHFLSSPAHLPSSICPAILLQGTTPPAYRSILLLTTLRSTYLILVSLEVIPPSPLPHTRLSPSHPNHQALLMGRKSMSVPPATVDLLPVAISRGTFAFTQVNVTTSVLFLDARHAVPGKTTYSNSESTYCPPYYRYPIVVVLSCPHSNRTNLNYSPIAILSLTHFIPAIRRAKTKFFFYFTVTAFIFRLAHDGAQAPPRALRSPVP